MAKEAFVSLFFEWLIDQSKGLDLKRAPEMIQKEFA